jgi:hypothetical protein
MDDLNLITEVIQILRVSGLNKLADDLNTKHSKDVETTLINQRHELNRYFNLVLIGLPVNTIEHRYCLIPNGLFTDWLKIFEMKIVPVLVEYSE